jgi:hypothetical protein
MVELEMAILGIFHMIVQPSLLFKNKTYLGGLQVLWCLIAYLQQLQKIEIYAFDSRAFCRNYAKSVQRCFVEKISVVTF